MTGEMGSVSELSHLYITLYNIMLLYMYISITFYYYILWFTLFRQTTLWTYKKDTFLDWNSLNHIEVPLIYMFFYHLHIIFHWLNHVKSTILWVPKMPPTSHVTSCHLYRLFGWPAQDQERWPSELTSWVCSLRFLEVLLQLLAHSVYIIWYSYIIYDMIILCIIDYILYILYYILYIIYYFTYYILYVYVYI